ncbi:MAG: tetratricopeptide repeat protein [Phycisphaerae bacterium]|nr:tetratricopeptide repeat protein [Phycisphaerae bacterium]
MARLSFICWISLVAASAAADLTPRHIASRDVRLACHAANHVAVERAQVWMSLDCGRNWSPLSDTELRGGEICFTLPEDGRYDLYVVLENAAGVSGPAPHSGDMPHRTLIVDTTSPLLQLHEAVPQRAADGSWQLRLRVSLIEEHLHAGGLRLFYRTSDLSWHDGGSLEPVDGVADWHVPQVDGDTLELKLVTADLAGNRAVSEPCTVCLPKAPPPVPVEVGETVESELAAPPAASEVVQAAPDESELAHARELRAAAKRFLERGRYGQAEEQLVGALTLAPEDPELLTDLGGVLCRAGRYDDAGRRFESALASDPGSRSAIEGLALVANTQRRYPEARRYLEQLLEQTPDSGLTWLRYGDVQHRLGDLDRAVEAWGRALEVAGRDKSLGDKARDRLNTFGPDRRARLTTASR